MAKAVVPPAAPPVPPQAGAAPAMPPLVGADGERLRDAPGEHTADLRTPMEDRLAVRITHADGPAPHVSADPAMRLDQVGARVTMPVQADPEAVSRALLPGAARPVPEPLPPVQAWGTKGDAKPATAIHAAFDRRYTIEALLGHPNAEVRQRAEEAQASLHHGAADGGILLRAAIDVARAAERTR